MTHFARLTLAASAVLLVAGCAVKVPVAVIGDKGNIMRGTATATMSGGTFQVAGKLHGREATCAGHYDSLSNSITITMAVTCSNGQKGIVIATRENNGINGSGRVRLEDGTEADFVFGTAAAAF